MARVQLNTNDATSWANWVTDFDRTYGLFQQTRARLMANANYVQTHQPQLYNQFSALVNRGTMLATQMQSLKQTRDRVAGWLTSVGRTISEVTSGSLSWLRNRFGLSCDDAANAGQQLGLAPVVWVGIGLAAAIAVLASCARWIAETVQMQEMIAQARRYEQQGYSADDASRMARRFKPGGSFELPDMNARIFGVPWVYVAAGVAALVVLPLVLRRA